MCDPHGSLLWSLCIEPADKAFYNRFFIPFLAGVAKKFLFEILELCLQICYDPVFFVIPDIAFLQHLLQRQDQIILGTDGCIQLCDGILQFFELDILGAGCHRLALDQDQKRAVSRKISFWICEISGCTVDPRELIRKIPKYGLLSTILDEEWSEKISNFTMNLCLILDCFGEISNPLSSQFN